ncbi:hypothetical protein HUJ04_008417, partial [Dendroctonus ponderosae]
NFRTTLLNTTPKLLTKIVANTITKEYTISEEQQSFLQNRSKINALFIDKQIPEKSIENNNPACMCFVGLTKAFDREMCDPRSLVAITRDINTDNETEIKVEDQLISEVDIKSGIRQRDSLSQLLFSLLMDKIEETKNVGRGYGLGRQQIKILCYADDPILIPDNKVDTALVECL